MNSPVVLVTGALTGIGRATALAFAKAGARVAVSGRRVAEGQVLERELQQLGADAVFFAADVRDDEKVRIVGEVLVGLLNLDTASVRHAPDDWRSSASLIQLLGYAWVVQRDHEHPVLDRSASSTGRASSPPHISPT